MLHRTRNFWSSGLEGIDRRSNVLILHLGLFWDEFRKFKNQKTSGTNVLMATLLEIGPSFWCKSEFGSVDPIVAFNSKHGNAEFANCHVFPIYTAQLKELAKGIEFYCEPLDRKMMIFAFVTELIGFNPNPNRVETKLPQSERESSIWFASSDASANESKKDSIMSSAPFLPTDIIPSTRSEEKDNELVNLESERKSSNFMSGKLN